MQRTTARILLLAGVLVPLVNAVLAKQPIQSQPFESKDGPVFKDLSINGDALLRQTSLPRSHELKGTRPKGNQNLLKSTKTRLRATLSSLKAPPDLALPNKPAQVTTRELRPLTIEEVGELSEVNSPTLKIFASRVEQRKSLLLSAISAWYPTVNLTANGLPQYLVGEQYRNSDFTTTPDTKSKQWSSALSVQVKWNLIDPARVPEIAAARDNYEKAINSYLIALRDLRLQALRQYFLLQRADEGVRIGKQSMRASLLSLRDSKARYKAGVATKLEVLEAETQLARDKQLLTSKLGDQNIARRSLAGLLNLPQDITPTAASPARVIGIWESSLQESIIAAYKYREELNDVLLDISINNSNANAALAASQPKLSIFNTYSASNYQGQLAIDSSSDIDMDDYGWSTSNTIGLNATWNIFDGGKAKALYRFNKQKAKESEAQFASKRDGVRREVEQSFFNLNTANQDIATTSRQVLASREALRLARLRFKAGVTTQREVVNNQRDLTQSEVRYADAIAIYNTSLAQLSRHTGLDEIKSCKQILLPAEKPENDEFIEVPIEPIPVKPACQALNLPLKKST